MSSSFAKKSSVVLLGLLGAVAAWTQLSKRLDRLTASLEEIAKALNHRLEQSMLGAIHVVVSAQAQPVIMIGMGKTKAVTTSEVVTLSVAFFDLAHSPTAVTFGNPNWTESGWPVRIEPGSTIAPTLTYSMTGTPTCTLEVGSIRHVITEASELDPATPSIFHYNLDNETMALQVIYHRFSCVIPVHAAN